MRVDSKRTIFHIDVNSAYLSWEATYRLQQGARVDLREIPSIVGGDPKTRHGIVLAKSIPAKKYKIKTGDTLHEALKKCKDLVIVPPSYELYMKCSSAMVELLKMFSPTIQRYSVDECFLDMTGVNHPYDNPVNLAMAIKEKIYTELGFSVNIGISSNKLLAKMASDFTKPNKVHTLYPSEVKKKMWPLPVRDLFMIGKATEKKLHDMGIYTIEDVAKTDLTLLRYRLKSHGEMIYNYANGIEDSPVRTTNYINIKGIGNSTTMSFDVEDEKTAYMILLGLTETVSMRLRNNKSCCKVISVEMKNTDFRRYTHQRKIFSPIDTTDEIYEIVKVLFDESWKKEPLRHLGIRLSDLRSNEFYQMCLFDKRDMQKKRSLDKAIDKIRLDHGKKSIVRASFIHSGVKPLIGGVGAEDYPMMSSIL